MKNLAKYKYRLTKVFRLHQSFVVLVAMLILLVAVVFRVNSLNDLPLDQEYLNTESSKVTTVRFDEKAIEEIKALRDSNVASPGTQLPTDRQNPFNE
jgi:hypothetical protein